MKRILGTTLALLSMGVVMSAEARPSAASNASMTVEANANPQWDRYGRRNDRRYYNRRSRTVTRSRFVRYGRRLYRETYLVRYFPNGRTDTRLISRVRVG